MDMNLSVMVPNHEEDSDVRESAMGGKHQRSLSLSAKWASDKAMAIEYLRRQREVMTWIESVLKRELPTTDLFEALKSGVVLREMMETLFPDVSNCMSPISRNYTKRMAPWKERENISVFLRQCKSIGMYDLSLFCTDDLYEGTNMVQVLFCVQHFMMFSEEHAGHLFKPIAKNEPAEFSNQELEMAMSKIEQAGVDAKALQGLISANNASGIPEKATNSTKSSSLRPASEPTLKEEKFECVEEEEPVESDCSAKDKPELEAQPEVCNQASEDRQEVEGPANEDDAHPEQESGSDVGDEEEVVDSQDTALPEQDMFVAEVLNTDVPSITDDETLEAIKQVLSDMAAAIEEAETENRLKEERAIPTTLMEPDALNAEMSNLPVVEELVAEPTDSADLENNVETVDETNIEVNVKEEIATPAAESGDSTDPTPVEEVTDAQPFTEAVQTAQKPAATEEEELEAKAMAKCTCGRCAIM